MGTLAFGGKVIGKTRVDGTCVVPVSATLSCPDHSNGGSWYAPTFDKSSFTLPDVEAFECSSLALWGQRKKEDCVVEGQKITRGEPVKCFAEDDKCFDIGTKNLNIGANAASFIVLLLSGGVCLLISCVVGAQAFLGFDMCNRHKKQLDDVDSTEE